MATALLAALSPVLVLALPDSDIGIYLAVPLVLPVLVVAFWIFSTLGRP